MEQIPSLKNYRFIKKIGEGSFAVVWLGEHILTKRSVAIKVVRPVDNDIKSFQTKMVREIELCKKVDHPFIASLFDVIQEPLCSSLVMEYSENGNLLEYVNNKGALSEQQARKYFSQIVCAVEYLHADCHIVHRDLKAENILLDRHSNIKLIDFGLSKGFTDDEPYLDTACGSPAYAPPEMIIGKKYSKAVDIWSLGVMLYAMVVGRLPFDDQSLKRVLKKIVYTQLEIPITLSAQLIDLLSKLLEKNPESRITIEKIKEHPWFSQSEYNSIVNTSMMNATYLESKGIDREIVDQIASYGYNTKQLQSSLLNDEYNEYTALYRLLNRERMIDLINSKLKTLSRGNATSSNKNSISNLPELIKIKGRIPPHPNSRTPAPNEKTGHLNGQRRMSRPQIILKGAR